MRVKMLKVETTCVMHTHSLLSQKQLQHNFFWGRGELCGGKSHIPFSTTRILPCHPSVGPTVVGNTVIGNMLLPHSASLLPLGFLQVAAPAPAPGGPLHRDAPLVPITSLLELSVTEQPGRSCPRRCCTDCFLAQKALLSNVLLGFPHQRLGGGICDHP